MAKLHETDLSSPIFKKVAILSKERTFLFFFYATLGVCRGHSQGRRAFISSLHLRPANVQPGRPGAELPARPAGNKAPGNLGFMRKNHSRRSRAVRSGPLLGGVGTTWQELAAGQARSVPARKPKFFDHFATSSAVNARRSPETSPNFSFCVHSSTGRAPTFQAGDVGSRPAARSNKRTNAWKSKHGGLPT